FDGVCIFCSATVQWIIKNDPKAYFQLAALQSPEAQLLLAGKTLPPHTDSIVLLEQGKVYTESTAALRITRKLRMPYPLLYGLIIIPPFVRNGVYRFIARNRYRWFGRRDSCMIPNPKQQKHFYSKN